VGTALVGANSKNVGKGAAYVFVCSGTAEDVPTD
jgi:hypothetical protein